MFVKGRGSNRNFKQEIERIRKGFLLGNEAATQLQENLGGSLSRLSADLSRHKHRFVHELLQNADDCDYPDSVVPAALLILSQHEIICCSN